MMTAVRGLWILSSGKMFFQGEPLDAELHSGLEQRSYGRALEFALWCQSIKPGRIVASA